MLKLRKYLEKDQNGTGQAENVIGLEIVRIPWETSKIELNHNFEKFTMTKNRLRRNFV